MRKLFKLSLSNNSMGKRAIAIILFIIIMPLIYATEIQQAELKQPIMQGKCGELIQTCSNCSFVTLTSILYPNYTLQNININMTKSGTTFNYTLCKTTTSGDGLYNTLGDPDGSLVVQSVTYHVTSTGDLFDNSQGLMVLGQLGIIALFAAIGFSFSKDKWKMRSLFFMGALMMGVITLNSIRILSGTSSNLYSMGNIGLILGMIILTFMFAYMLVYYTIEVFKYFKNKRSMRWEVSQNAN